MTKLTQFMKKNKGFSLWTAVSLAVVMIALLAPFVATHDPYEAVLTNGLQAPNADHICGTDALGRDLFSRIIYGTRASLSGTFAIVLVIFSVGTLLGVVAGYFGGFLDTAIMRLADTMIAFPDLILAMAIAGILGPSMINAVIAIAVVSWTKYARMSRSLIMKIRSSDYIAAARVTGSTTGHILKAYLLPNALPTMVVTAATDIGAMMLALSSLSFLGFGIKPPTPEWGYMLSESRQYFQTAPWLMLFPGLAIFIVVVVFNLWGDSLRDVLDPKENAGTIRELDEELVNFLNYKATVKNPI